MGFLTALVLCAQAAAAQKMLVVAHRGEPKLAPENSAASIKMAYDLGAKWVETDFHATKYGTIICIHCENSLRNLTGLDRIITEISPDDLSIIDLASGKWKGKYDFTPIPTLTEILAIVPKDRGLQTEIKGYAPYYPEAFDKAVKDAGLKESQILVSSFSAKALKDFKAQKPLYETMLLCKANGEPAAKIILTAKDCGVKYVALGDYMKISRAYADDIRAAGFEFRVYGVNTLEQLKKAAELGATGFTCDGADKMKKDASALNGLVLE